MEHTDITGLAQNQPCIFVHMGRVMQRRYLRSQRLQQQECRPAPSSVTPVSHRDGACGLSQLHVAQHHRQTQRRQPSQFLQ